MSELHTRAQARAQEKAAGPAVRHGRLKQHHPLKALLKIVVAVIAVVGITGVSLAAYATVDVVASVKKSVKLVDAKGKETTPGVGAMNGAFNVLLAGSDSGGGNTAYGDREENLNDVTMLLHVSADHQNATVVSFPRDMFVSIPSCPDPKGGSFDAMSRQKINNSLSYGGLACTVLTVEKLTGLDIPYAGVIQFDGVIEMSNAVGGVPVCVAGDIKDPYTGLNVKGGQNVLQGSQALAFLRTRHGVGDGSDLGRISNQQVFLSSLVRTIKSADVLSNPVKLYGLAKAATSNITLSDSLNNPTTIVSMAMALKNIDISKVVFVQYPNHYVDGGVAPTTDAADQLMSALQNDKPITLTGDTGVGSEADPNAPATQAPATQAPATQAPATGTPDSGTAGGGSVELPSDVHGQTAAQYTCSKPFSE
ncbi:LCP family protein [Leifsonia sp. 21MFCrub1.1]|uniref:LCP family protein n=1 Tax=Leifsonia sp. 21MFCrub1.1 TaxID=1798223 RepID=UPI00089280FA|nr:LCP family protein [Leifsonia sp. 21MFCrub1.1]SEA33327.1 cell envelope-related function transcriptional attenuator common domain-containing protein [Leifsonia sp. 21MFCrub1.1]